MCRHIDAGVTQFGLPSDVGSIERNLALSEAFSDAFPGAGDDSGQEKKGQDKRICLPILHYKEGYQEKVY